MKLAASGTLRNWLEKKQPSFGFKRIERKRKEHKKTYEESDIKESGTRNKRRYY